MRRLACALLAAAPLACSSSTITTPERPIPNPTPLVPPVVTITASGLDIPVLHIGGDTVITFVNQDTRSHQVRSDLHPTHTECGLMNLEPIEPGQSGQSGRIAAGQGCGYHLEEDPGRVAYQGFVLAH